MLLDTVDFPDELIDDLLAGKLVVFAGAGVSLEKPSSLPTFVELLECVKGEQATTEDKNDLFKAFERLEDSGTDIRTLVRHAVSHKKSLGYSEQSEPNGHHTAIISLFKDASQIKVITTNFDSHLTKVLPENVPQYIAPALPKGDNFSGLVYLHGKADHNLDDLVITERDVAQSYIKYGRTTAFLRELFNYYTVLFIGSSHDDQILNLIAKSDLFNGKRYILTEKGREKNWKKLNIHPVEYEKESHGKAWFSLDLLKSLISLSNIQTAEFIREKCQGDPGLLLPHENGWLKYLLLRKTDFTEIFVEHAKDSAWLRWAKDSGLLNQLFSTSMPDEPSIRHRMQRFSFWFCSYIGEFSDICLEVIREKTEYNINLILLRHLNLAIFRLGNVSYFNEWMHIICNAHRHYGLRDSDELTSMLARSSLSEDKNLLINLLEFLSEPRPSKQEYPPVDFYGDSYWLHKAWENLFSSNFEELYFDLIQILPRNLQKLQHIYGGRRIPGYYLYQDRDGSNIASLLVKANQDLLIFLLKEKSDLGKMYRETWLQKDDNDIFKRIAKSVSEQGDIIEVIPKGKAGWVKNKSPVTVEYLLENPPAINKDMLLNWDFSSLEDVEDNFIETNREGLMQAVADAASQNHDWSLKLLELLDQQEISQKQDLAIALLKGWKKAGITQVQWPEILKLIRDRAELMIYSAGEVIELISAGIESKENAIPESLYLECLQILQACSRSSQRSLEISGIRNWYVLSLNDHSGMACSVIIDIISKARVGWSKATLQEMMNLFLLPFVEGLSPALATIGRYSFYLFLWNEPWFHQHIIPIMKRSEENHNIFEATWHGVSYSHESNRSYLPVLVENLKYFYENSGNILSDTEPGRAFDDDIPEGISRVTCLTILRSVVWKDAAPITGDWIKNFVSGSTPNVIAGVLNDFRQAIQAEEHVAKKVDIIWEKAIQPIIKAVASQGLSSDFTISKSIIEIVPYLGASFRDAVSLAEKSIRLIVEGDIHPRVYGSIKETKIYATYPEACYEFIKFTLSNKYAEFNWFIDEVFECFDFIVQYGVEKQKVIDLINEYVFPRAPEPARKYCSNLLSSH